MKKNENKWPFPSVEFQKVISKDGSWIEPCGDLNIVNSYLERFGAVPVYSNGIRTVHTSDMNLGCNFEDWSCPPISFDQVNARQYERKIARKVNGTDWSISVPDGSTPLEADPVVIKGNSKQTRILTSHNWFHIGYLQSSLIEFEFKEDGEGYSRYVVWGWDTKVPEVKDFWWKYTLKDSCILIDWEDKTSTLVQISIIKQLRAAYSRQPKGLSFFDVTLTVDKPLFPPTVDFAKHLLKEYWGRIHAMEEEI